MLTPDYNKKKTRCSEVYINDCYTSTYRLISVQAPLTISH